MPNQKQHKDMPAKAIVAIPTAQNVIVKSVIIYVGVNIDNQGISKFSSIV